MTRATRSFLSRHATARGQQRGIPAAVIEAIVAFHDVECEAGSGCRVLRVSRRSAADGRTEGFDKQLLDRLPRIAVLWSDDNSQVVSVLRDVRRGRGRRYRIRK